MSRRWRTAVLVALVAGTLVAVLFVPPIRQDPAYHAFADGRSFFGVPNFLNVVSNLAFLVVGILGIGVAMNARVGSARPAWVLLFVGLALVSAGSAWYHWSPDNDSLLWDRLPMTVGFMGLLVALVDEHVHPGLVERLLAPAVLLGLGSALYWHFTDDLRFYAWIQFMPLLVILALLFLFDSRYTHNRLLVAALGLYGAAKLAEHYDSAVFTASGELVSGHTLKHLLAATGGLVLVLLLHRRQLRP